MYNAFNHPNFFLPGGESIKQQDVRHHQPGVSGKKRSVRRQILLLIAEQAARNYPPGAADEPSFRVDVLEALAVYTVTNTDSRKSGASA